MVASSLHSHAKDNWKNRHHVKIDAGLHKKFVELEIGVIIQLIHFQLGQKSVQLSWSVVFSYISSYIGNFCLLYHKIYTLTNESYFYK